MGINGIDWLMTGTYADIKQEEDNRNYEAAECKEPHADGSTCLPSWDGFVYVCLDRIARDVEVR